MGKFPLRKIVGASWKEGEIRLGVDNIEYTRTAEGECFVKNLELGRSLVRGICVTLRQA